MNNDSSTFGSIVGLAAGGAYVGWRARQQGVTASDIRSLFSLSDTVTEIKNPVRDFLSKYNSDLYERQANTLEMMRKRVQRVAEGRVGDGEITAMKSALLDVSRRPAFANKLNAKSWGYADMSTRLASIKTADDMSAFLKTAFSVLDTEVPEFKTEVGLSFESLNARLGDSGAKRGDFTTAFNTAKRRKPSSVLVGKARNQVSLKDIDTKGLKFWDAFQSGENSLVSQLRKRGYITENNADFVNKLDRDGRLIKIRSGKTRKSGKPRDSYYANLHINGEDVMVPLTENFRDLSFSRGGERASASVYHMNASGSAMYSFPNYVATTAKGEIDSIRTFEEAMFYGRDPMLLRALEESQASGQPLSKVISSFDGSADTGMFRMMQYVNGSEASDSISMKNAGAVTVFGVDGIREVSESDLDTFNKIKSQLERKMESGGEILPWSSPGGSSNVGSLRFKKEGKKAFRGVLEGTDRLDQPSLVDLFESPDQMAGHRRPEQMLTNPYTLTNPEEVQKSMSVHIRNGGKLFDPLSHPIFKTGAFKEMSQGPMGNYLRRSIAPVAVPTIYQVKGKQLGLYDDAGEFSSRLGEGAALYLPRENRIEPKWSGVPRSVSLARPGSQANVDIPMSPVFDEDFLSGLEAADNEGADARQKYVRDFFENHDWKRGDYLGTGVDPVRPGSQSFLEMSGKGKLSLRDMEVKEGKYVLQFEQEVGLDETKVFPGKVVMSSDPELQRELTGNLGRRYSNTKIMERLDFMQATTANGLLKKGNYLPLRSQQLTGITKSFMAHHDIAKPGSVVDLDTLKIGAKERKALGLITGSHKGTDVSTTAFGRLRSVADAHGQEFVRQAQELIGDSSAAVTTDLKHLFGLHVAAYGTGATNKEAQGLIFGLEQENYTKELYKNADVMTALETGVKSYFGKSAGDHSLRSYFGNLSEGIDQAKYVIGDDLVMPRNIEGEYGNTVPRLEQRAAELVANKNDWYVMARDLDRGDITFKDVFFEDLVTSLEVTDEKTRSAILNWNEKNKKASGSNGLADVFAPGRDASAKSSMDWTDFKEKGGYLDLEDIVGADSDVRRMYIPSSAERDLIDPRLYLGDESSDFSGLGKKVDLLERQYKDWTMAGEAAKPAFAKRIADTASRIKGAQINTFMDVASEFVRAPIKTASYLTMHPASRAPEGMTAKDLTGTPYVKSASTYGDGVVHFANEKTINTLMNKVKAANPELTKFYEEEEKAMISSGKKRWKFEQGNKKLNTPGRYVLDVGADLHVAAIMWNRNPNTNEWARQLTGLAYDPRLDDSAEGIIHQGYRAITEMRDGKLKEIDVSPHMAASLAADFDFDQASVSVVGGKYAKEASQFMNDPAQRAALALTYETPVRSAMKLEDLIKTQIDNRFGGKLVSASDFGMSMATLRAQSQIGSVSKKINFMKHVLRNSELSNESMNTLNDLMYSLEQRGVDYKATSGQSPGEAMADELTGIMESKGGSDATKANFKNFLRDWLGDDAVNNGYDITDSAGNTKSYNIGKMIDEIDDGALALMTDTDYQSAVGLAIDRSGAVFDRAATSGMQSALARHAEQMAAGIAHSPNLQVGAIIAAASEHALNDMTQGLGAELSAMALAIKNNAIRHAAKNRRVASKAMQLVPHVFAGLGMAAMVHSFFDKGYSSKPLEGPVGPNGENPTINLAMREAIASGELMNESTLNSPMPRNRDAMPNLPQVPAPIPMISDTIPISATIQGTGRIRASGMVDGGVSPVEIADRLRATMPYAQTSVNVSHKHSMPRDLESEL